MSNGHCCFAGCDPLPCGCCRHAGFHYVGCLLTRVVDPRAEPDPDGWDWADKLAEALRSCLEHFRPDAGNFDRKWKERAEKAAMERLLAEYGERRRR